MIFQYNPYNPAGAQNPYGNQNPFQNQQQGPKKVTIPTWLFWLIIVAFLGFAVWLWFWLS